MGFKTTKMHTGNKDSWAPEPLSQGTTSRGHQVHPPASRQGNGHPGSGQQALPSLLGSLGRTAWAPTLSLLINFQQALLQILNLNAFCACLELH